MYISNFRIQNYKSFLTSEEFSFVPGFNLIVGANNAGKTALVEALTLTLGNKPHLSTKTLPRPGAPMDGTSGVEVSFQLAGGEAEQLLFDSQSNIYVPVGDQPDMQASVAAFDAAIRDKPTLACQYQSGRFWSVTLDLYDRPATATASTQAFQLNRDAKERKFIPTTGITGINSDQTSGFILAYLLRERVYVFKAERLKISQHAFGPNRTLQPDAANLPEVLHNLQASNPDRFRKFNQHVRTIFPDIKWVAVPSHPGTGGVRILLWPIDTGSEREDLAIELSESGTGIGQVLAMLYVVVDANYPRTIVIDEPQSFLHPGAVRKLVDIFKEYPQHQYIITTHSSEVVAATEPQYLILLRKEGFETVSRELNVHEMQEVRIYLSEVGARLSDVFGSDSILWVEGPTEEICYPVIVEKVLKKQLLGIKILGVIKTGDFESKHSERILQIYDRLSTGSGLVPPAIGFIFDRERKTEQLQADLIRRGHGKVHFLSRTMYENYLLKPDAIAHVVSDLGPSGGQPVGTQQIKDWLTAHKWDTEYFDRQVEEDVRTDQYWIQHVHGAKLLSDIFAAFADVGVEYDKVKHGLALTQWLADNTPDDLREVAGIIEPLIS